MDYVKAIVCDVEGEEVGTPRILLQGSQEFVEELAVRLARGEEDVFAKDRVVVLYENDVVDYGGRTVPVKPGTFERKQAALILKVFAAGKKKSE